jgi:hypothetical protein
MFDANRRKYPRANYPCQLTIWLANGQETVLLANTANIGTGGLCVYLNEEVTVGTKVDIQLQFTDETSTPFKCRGAVVRCQKQNNKYYDVGVQFEPLGELKHAFLDGKISELMALEKRKI